MFFCLGNICRSPLAEGVFKAQAAARGVAERFHVESSGTSGYHVGEPPDPGSLHIARKLGGLDLSAQRAQQLNASHLSRFDLLVGMSGSNLRDARRLPGAAQARLVLMRSFEPDAALRGADVPDPWGRGEDAFEEVYRIVWRCSERLLDELLTQLDA